MAIPSHNEVISQDILFSDSESATFWVSEDRNVPLPSPARAGSGEMSERSKRGSSTVVRKSSYHGGSVIP